MFSTINEWARDTRWLHTPMFDFGTLRAVGTNFSFPSDHSVAAGAAAAGVWLVDRRLLSRPLTWLVERLTATPLRPILAGSAPARVAAS